MPTLKPRPLSSNARATKLSDLEKNLFDAVRIIGGASYSNGVVDNASGALVAENMKSGVRWLSNSRKTEPYAWTMLTSTLDTVSTGTTELLVPLPADLDSPSTVDLAISYGSITGAANFTGSLGANIAVTSGFTITTLGPLASARTSSPLTYQAPAAGDAGCIKLTLGIATVGVTLKDVVMLVAIKSKHIA